MSLLKKFTYSVRGFLRIILFEQSIRIHMITGAIVLLLAFWFNLSKTDLAIIIIIVFLVVIMEAFNTILERIIDLTEPRYREHVKEIKDALAGLVLFISIAAIIVGIIIFWPYIQP